MKTSTIIWRTLQTVCASAMVFVGLITIIYHNNRPFDLYLIPKGLLALIMGFAIAMDSPKRGTKAEVIFGLTFLSYLLLLIFSPGNIVSLYLGLLLFPFSTLMAVISIGDAIREELYRRVTKRVSAEISKLLEELETEKNSPETSSNESNNGNTQKG